MPLAGWENMPLHSPYFEGDLLAILSGQRTLPFEPGTEFRYGSSDFFLLGLVVKRVTGQSLAAFARERVFEPLGMSRTFYLEDGSRVVKNRAVPYHKLLDPRGPWHQWPVNGYVVGGGGVWTSVRDLAQFDRGFDDMKLARGRPGTRQDRLPGARVREFFESGSVLGNRFCLDADAYRKKVDPELAVDNPPGFYRGVKRIQFTGGWFGMASAMARFPDEQFTIICLSNSEAISPFAKIDEIAEVVLGDKLQPKPTANANREPSPDAPELTPADYVALEGAFRMHDHGGVWRVTVREGLLYYTNHLSETFELRHIGGNRFEAVDTPYVGDVFVFRKTSDDAAYSLWLESGENEIGFDRVELVHPSADELATYAGEFYNDELLATYRFQVREGALWLRVNNRRWERLDPTTRDEFVLHDRHPHDIRIFSFERDGSGKVERLRVNFWRVQGLTFSKQP
jgi:CubicO group peptidase (beta-lactamase class C family)